MIGTSDGWPVYTTRPLPEGEVEKIYRYTDAFGRTLFEVLRFRPKSFLTLRTRPDGSRSWGMKDVTPVLYRLPRVCTAHTVLLLEGEKDVETAERLGLPEGWAASCNPFGACMWRPEYSAMLAGKYVVICPDTDEFGQIHLHEVAVALIGKTAGTSVVRLPSSVKDLSEWVQAGGDAAAFAALLRGAETLVYPKPDSSRLRVTGEVKWAISRLLALRGVYCESQAVAGSIPTLVAHEVAEVFPEWIGEHTDGGQYVAVKGFEPLVTTALREVQACASNITERLDALEQRLSDLASRECGHASPDQFPKEQV
jgi:hypothetical protein